MPSDPTKVVIGISMQFVGYGFMGLGAITVYAGYTALVEAPVLVSLPDAIGGAAEFSKGIGLGTFLFSTGVGSWMEGTQLIYQGYSELPTQGK
jgi:hypothetical protein